jgi:hypothetical protein
MGKNMGPDFLGEESDDYTGVFSGEVPKEI